MPVPLTQRPLSGRTTSAGGSATTNRITNANYTYDSAGNLTQDGTGTGTHTYQWDAENRMTSVDSGSTASYTYNALGQRAESHVGTAYSEFVYDSQGVEVGRHDRSSAFLWQYLILGNRRFGKYQDGKNYFTVRNENRLAAALGVFFGAGLDSP